MIWFRTKEIVALKKVYKNEFYLLRRSICLRPPDVSCRRLVYERHSTGELRTKIVFVRYDS